MKNSLPDSLNFRPGNIALAFLFCMLLGTMQLYAQITLEADGAGNTYELINDRFGAEPEDPDCSHTAFGRHITEAFDSQLGKNVFIFHIHADIDNDRCTNFDRQRNEIKGGSGSPAGLKHTEGETAYVRWKFKLDAAFVPSSRFTHIMQIKALDGDAGAPLMTLTPRAGSPQKMEVIHSSGEGSGSQGKIAEVDLAPFKGAWVEAFMQFKSSEGSAGTFSLVIKRISDGATLLSVSRTGIDMWRTGASFNRPKWGIYRGLDDVLRDEQVRFADFCISESSASQCPSSIGGVTAPSAPTGLGATPVSPTQINLAWADNANNENAFRIERSLDAGSTWSLLANVGANTTSYANTGLSPLTTYHYRVRAENAGGNSAFSNTANATTPNGTTLQNVALNKTATASSSDTNVPAGAVDGSTTTRWSASPLPQWLEVDLGAVYDISRTEVVSYEDRAYQFVVEAKTTSSGAYTQIVNRSSNTTPGTIAAPITDNFAAVNARYVRITVTGASGYTGPWASLIEFRVFGTAVITSPVSIYIEAESGTITAPMQVQSNSSASGGQYITVASGNNSNAAAPATGRATYNFTVPSAGTYKVWGRSVCPTNSDDSFWVRVDNSTWVNWNEMPVGTTWAWDDLHDFANNNAVITYNLSAGAHTLEVAYREDGAQLDQLLVTNDLSLNPGVAAASAMREGQTSQALRIKSYPNPATREAIVTYQVEEGGPVSISLYDMVENRTIPLVDQHQPAGEHNTTVDLSHLPSGLYIIRVTHRGKVTTHKILKK